MATVTYERKAPAVDCSPIDTELIGDSTDATLKMELSTFPRGHQRQDDGDHRAVALLLGEKVGAEEDPAVRDSTFLFMRTWPA